MAWAVVDVFFAVGAAETWKEKELFKCVSSFFLVDALVVGEPRYIAAFRFSRFDRRRVHGSTFQMATSRRKNKYLDSLRMPRKSDRGQTVTQ